MKKIPLLLTALLVTSVASAESGKPQYVTDQITLGIHVKPDNDAGSIGVVKSGDRVTVLQTLGENSFARIRTANGVEGWVVARDLSDDPAAQTQLSGMKKDLSSAQSQIKTLQSQLDSAQKELVKAKPALDLADDNDKLRRQIKQREAKLTSMEQRYSIEKAHRETLITGAVLACGGIIFGLMLPWLGSGRRRRRNEL